MNKFYVKMKKLNEEQRIIVDDILFFKKKTHQNLYIFFYKRYRDKKNIHNNVHYTKYVTTLHKRNDRC